LSAGNYTVLVKDGTGCIEAFSVAVATTTGPAFSPLSHTDVTCYGGDDGSITLGATGGTGTLEYSIGGAYQTNTSFPGLSAGLYYVTVRDAVGCTDSDTIRIDEGAPINVSATVNNNVSCHGGNDASITVSASGGIGTLAYSIDGTNYQSLGSFTGLSANSALSAYVRDAGGCVNSTMVSITEPTAITGNLGALDITCFGSDNGSVFVTASGGTGTLQYSLNGGTYGSTTSWNNLAPGMQTVEIKDANNCLLALSATLTEPDSVNVSSTISNVSCAGGDNGVINASVSGGNAPYAFTWSNGSADEDIFNLTAGTYDVTVSDANGCMTTRSYMVTEPSNPLSVNGVVTNETIVGANDGAVDITVTGGTAPYSYSWSNGVTATTQDLTSVSSGAYIVVVTDANGCETTAIFTVSIGTAVTEAEMAENNVLLYPNPAKNYTTVEVDGFETNIINKVRVFDALGKMVYNTPTNDAKVEINTGNYLPGLYLIQIEVDGHILTKKLNIIR